MFKLLKIAAFALLVPVLALSGSATVAAAGQIEGGDIYRVRNVTQGGGFIDPAQTKPCDVVQFRVRVHNPGPDPINSVNVKATLSSGVATSHSSMVTITSNTANPNSVSDTAGVRVSEAVAIGYVGGSTELLDANGSVMNSLPDGILGGGVNIGNVGVSVDQKRFVQFKAKLNCKDKPEKCPEGTTGTPPNCVTPPTPDKPEKPIPESPKTSPAPAGQAPATIAATGPEAIVSGVVGSSALGYSIRRFLASKAALRDALNQ